MGKRPKGLIKSLLLVDDDQDALDMYGRLVERELSTSITACKFPGQALKLADEHFFGMALIDVTMNYNGTPFGGFELYRSLLSRYGSSSLILYSQYVNTELLDQYGYNFNFFEKGHNLLEFAQKIAARCEALRKRQSCFVAMPFDEQYDPVFDVIRSCVEHVSYRCVRVDRQAFTKSIVDKIFEEIRNSKLVIFLATGQNPNAFYECGYAVALKKEVVTITDSYASLPFDIRDRSAISYGEDLGKLKSELIRKLEGLTEGPP